ncbi:hypothetical protein [Bacillus cereus]|nr:hypothetical protein [Bacillus cereus]
MAQNNNNSNNSQQPQPPQKPAGPEPRWIHENFSVKPEKDTNKNK